MRGEQSWFGYVWEDAPPAVDAGESVRQVARVARARPRPGSAEARFSPSLTCRRPWATYRSLTLAGKVTVIG